MNHGIVAAIERVLAEAPAPVDAAFVSCRILAPEFWSDEKLKRNVAVLLCGYAGRKWRRSERGLYWKFPGL